MIPIFPSISESIEKWGTVGLTGQWANLPISLYGRNSASGTYGFFKQNVLDGCDYKANVKEQPGSSSVIQGVASELGGIGYSGIEYMTSDEMRSQMQEEILKNIQKDPDDAKDAKAWIALLSVNRHLERLGDMATNVAEDVIYMVEGDIIRHGVQR